MIASVIFATCIGAIAFVAVQHWLSYRRVSTPRTRAEIQRDNLRSIFSDVPWQRPAGLSDFERARLRRHVVRETETR